ncbi:MAG: winged helix-turn-helix domain-containing protein [Candidatus Nanohaloarchaea archaeon]|nr:winged helix-turn-helix domain-containing protein [Candidatus Nanohaloarchaea archaeon]
MSEEEPEVIDLSEDGTDRVDALTSETRLDIIHELQDETLSMSEIADRLDVSLPNVQYHIGQLQDADLVQEAGRRKSDGADAHLFTAAPVVVVAGPSSFVERLKQAARLFLGITGILASPAALWTILERTGILWTVLAPSKSANGSDSLFLPFYLVTLGLLVILYGLARQRRKG